MICRSLLQLTSVAFLALSAVAQTFTTTDLAGDTIVEVLTLNALGLPTTIVLSTLTDDDVPGAVTSTPTLSATTSSTPSLSTPSVPALTTPSTTSTTSTTPLTPTLQTVATTAPDQQGPVGAPPATTAAAGPTIYTYTTTDANGDTIAVVDTFTATTPSTTPFTPQTTGTVLNYSQWLSIYGGASAGSDSSNVTAAQAAGSQRLGVGRSWIGVTAGVLAGLFGGVWLVAL